MAIDRESIMKKTMDMAEASQKASGIDNFGSTGFKYQQERAYNDAERDKRYARINDEQKQKDLLSNAAKEREKSFTLADMQNKREEGINQRYLDAARIRRGDPLNPEGDFAGNAMPVGGGGGGSRTGSRASGGKAEMTPGQTQYEGWVKDPSGREPDVHSGAWKKFNAVTPGGAADVKAFTGETQAKPEQAIQPQPGVMTPQIGSGALAGMNTQSAIPSSISSTPSLSAQGSPQFSDAEERNRIRTERQARTGYVPTPNGPGYGYYKGEDLPAVGTYMNGRNGLTEVTQKLQDQLRAGTAGTVSQGQYPGVKPGMAAQIPVNPAQQAVPVEGAYTTTPTGTSFTPSAQGIGRTLPEQGRISQPASPVSIQGATPVRTLPEQSQPVSTQGMQFQRFVPGMQGEQIAEYSRPDGISFFTNRTQPTAQQSASQPVNTVINKPSIADSAELQREKMRVSSSHRLQKDQPYKTNELGESIPENAGQTKNLQGYIADLKNENRKNSEIVLGRGSFNEPEGTSAQSQYAVAPTGIGDMARNALSLQQTQQQQPQSLETQRIAALMKAEDDKRSAVLMNQLSQQPYAGYAIQNTNIPTQQVASQPQQPQSNNYGTAPIIIGDVNAPNDIPANLQQQIQQAQRGDSERKIREERLKKRNKRRSVDNE